jgi:hypothetical protein
MCVLLSRDMYKFVLVDVLQRHDLEFASIVAELAHTHMVLSNDVFLTCLKLGAISGVSLHSLHGTNFAGPDSGCKREQGPAS